MLTVENAGAFVRGLRSEKEVEIMKIKITRQTFIKGRHVKPGEVVEVDPADYHGNLLNKAVPFEEKPKAKPAKVKKRLKVEGKR